MEAAESHARIDAGWAVAGWLGDGDCQLSDELRTGIGSRSPASGRLRGGDKCGQRHGSRNLDLDDAGRRRESRTAGRSREVHPWRHATAEGSRAWRVVDD